MVIKKKSYKTETPAVPALQSSSVGVNEHMSIDIRFSIESNGGSDWVHPKKLTGGLGRSVRVKGV